MNIKINGGLRAKSGKNIILTLYSSPLARYFLSHNINFVNIRFLGNVIKISMGKLHRICIERKKERHPLAIIFITKLVPKNLKEIIRKAGKQIQIGVIIKDIISKKGLEKYNHRLNRIEPKKGLKIPYSNLIKLGCYISCFRQKNGIWYRFNVRNRILEKVANDKIKVLLSRKGNEFFIIKDNDGKELKLYRNPMGHPLTYVQISEAFLSDEEIDLFKEKRRAISFKAFISSKEFNLDISQFFFDKYERDLAKALMNKGLKIGIPEMGKREADILLPEINGQIEVTKVMPASVKKEKNNAHGEGVHINARLCEGFLRVQKGLVKRFFVVFHRAWSNYNWVNDICNIIKPSVIPIFTEFDSGWAEKVSEEIKSYTLK